MGCRRQFLLHWLSRNPIFHTFPHIPYPKPHTHFTMHKFAFDTSFDDPDPRKLIEPTAAARAEILAPIAAEPELPPEPAFSAEELQAARAVAWNDGMEAGRQDAENGLLARQNRLLEALTAQLEQIGTQVEGARGNLEQDAIRIAVAVVQTLYPHSFRAETQMEIVRTIREVLQTQENTTTPLTLTLAAADLAWLTPVVEGFGSQRFRLRVQEDLQSGDFRLEWTDGGIERFQSEIWDKITALVPEQNQESV